MVSLEHVKPHSHFPQSRRVYVEGKQHKDIRVPMREVETAEGNIALYDTSGAFGDCNVETKWEQGLAKIREGWIEGRGDTDFVEGPLWRPWREQRDVQSAPLPARRVRKAKLGQNVTQLHYARKGIITPEMEFIAIRENSFREKSEERTLVSREKRLRGRPFSASLPQAVTPEFVREEVAAGRAIIPNLS